MPGFIVQGGDPTGTGSGGESVYGAPFKVCICIPYTLIFCYSLTVVLPTVLDCEKSHLTWNAYMCSSCLHVLLQCVWICPSKLRVLKSSCCAVTISLGAQILREATHWLSSCVLFCLPVFFQVGQAPLTCDCSCKACFWAFHLPARLLHLAQTWSLWEGMVPEQRTKQKLPIL